jgi:hypothetical protein
MKKRHNESNATIYVNDKVVGNIYNSSLYYPWGWTERCECTDLPITKSVCSYYNRDWQQFSYESVMRDTLKKLQKYFATHYEKKGQNIKIKIIDENKHIIE